MGNLSPITFLLLPVALGLALMLAIALGSAGDPASLRRREGGVSRALAQRAAGAESDHAEVP